MRRSVVSRVLISLLATACLPRNAGYEDVSKLVTHRTGKRVRWNGAAERTSAAEISRLLSKPLTDDAAVQLALLNNPRVQAALEQLGAARAGIVQARALPNPVLEGALHFHGSSPDIDLSLTESISGLLFYPWRAGAARAELDAAIMDVGGGVLDFMLEVRSEYYGFVAAAQSVELTRSVLLAARASYDAARELFEAGNITALDLATERALYEESRLTAAQAETALSVARRRLTALLGLSESTQWTAAARLPEPSGKLIAIERAEQVALDRSIDLEATRRRFTAAARRANLSRAEGWLPDVRAGIGAERDEGEWGFGPVAEIELPLFYQGQGEVGRAAAEMRSRRHEYSALTIEIRARTREALTRLTEAHDRAVYYKTVLLPLRDEIVQQTQLQFNAMSAGVFQLLQAKRDQVQTARGYVEALRDYWTARAELEQILAGRLPRGAGMRAPTGGSSAAGAGAGSRDADH